MKGKYLTFSILSIFEINLARFSISSILSVIPGTNTYLIQVGLLISFKYFAKVKVFSLDTPVKSLNTFSL